MDQPRQSRSWRRKFRTCRARGGGWRSRGQSSFVIHSFCAVAVVTVAALARLAAWQWCSLLLCITVVLVAEMFNTALESLARCVRTEYDPQLRDALDIAAGAVLLAALGSVVVGAVTFLAGWL